MNITTTTKIMPADRDWLRDKYGKPLSLAIHKVIEDAQNACEHPEFARIPTVGIVSTNANYILTDDLTSRGTVDGFYCRKCANYVFPSLQLEVEA